jgi:putative Mg2+ transporter-C (MgtC) family protein
VRVAGWGILRAHAGDPGVHVDWEWHIAARLLMAAGLGAAIGLEREVSDQPAGLRTHLTVSVGAALFGVVSTTGFTEFVTTQRASNYSIDPTRVASIVVSGIGFIGAGLIFRSGGAVHNLTTAASVWVVAAIGLSCGVGDFFAAEVTTVIVLVGLIVLRLPRRWIRRFLRSSVEEIRIVLLADVADAPVVDALRGLSGITVSQLTIGKEDGAFVISAALRADPAVDLRDAVSPLARRDDVSTLRLGDVSAPR